MESTLHARKDGRNVESIKDLLTTLRDISSESDPAPTRLQNGPEKGLPALKKVSQGEGNKVMNMKKNKRVRKDWVSACDMNWMGLRQSKSKYLDGSVTRGYTDISAVSQMDTEQGRQNGSNPIPDSGTPTCL